MKITIDQFHGESPKTADRLLTNYQATATRNLDLRSGNLKQMKLPAKTDSTEATIKPKTIYLFNAQGEQRTWFESELELDILRGPLPNDTEERTYITGMGAPRMTYSSIATAGDPPYPSVTRLLGVPAPDAPPTVGVVGSVESEATGFSSEVTMGEDGEIESIDVTNGGAGYEGVISAVIKDQIIEPFELECEIDGTGKILNIRPMPEPEVVDGINQTSHDYSDTINVIALRAFKEGRLKLEVSDPHLLGSGAVVTPTYADGMLTSIALTDGGAAYSSETVVRVSAIAGTGCRLKAVAVDGAVQPIQIVTKGSGYTNPIVEVVATVVADTNVLDTTRAYVYTFVTEKGEEGPPSPPSALFDWTPGQTLSIELGQATVPGGGYAITKLRIYRYAQGASSGDFFFVGEVLKGDTQFIDNILDVELPGGMLVTTDFDPPPEEMLGLVSLTNGVMAGFSGREVCFCEPYLPYAWPVKYRLTVDYDIVGLGSLGNGVVVLTTGQPYLIMGTHPEAMGMEKLDIDQSCVSKRSIVSNGGSVVFASPDGLMLISPNGTENVTRDLYTREQWQKLAPKTLLGVFDEGRYLGFYDAPTGRGSFILDPTNPSATLTHSSVFADAVFRDKITDQIYIVDNEGGEWTVEEDSALWRSKKFITPKPVNFSAIQILGEGDVGVTVWADKTEIVNRQYGTGLIDRLPAGFLAREWMIELSGLTEIEQVDIATSVAEIANG